MGQLLHGYARTTAALRRTIQNSQESIARLAARYDINSKTVAKWRKRTDRWRRSDGTAPSASGHIYRGCQTLHCFLYDAARFRVKRRILVETNGRNGKFFPQKRRSQRTVVRKSDNGKLERGKTKAGSSKTRKSTFLRFSF